MLPNFQLASSGEFFLNAVLSIAASPQAERSWLVKFLLSFIPGFLGTGVLFGVLYVLIARAMRVDREKVEAWFESLRLRLQAGPVPILEWAQPIMLAALGTVYGHTALRRFLTSICIGFSFTSMVVGAAYLRYRQIPSSVHAAKTRIEQAIDPVLFRYVTDPNLRPQFLASQETNDGAEYKPQYVYDGGIYDELRDRVNRFGVQLVSELSKNPDRTDLTILFLFDGPYFDPGFNWSAFPLFAFNVLVDFLSVTIAFISLRRLGSDPSSFTIAISTFVSIFIGTLGCASVAFLSYAIFFRGDTGFFWQLLIQLPIALACGLFCVYMVIEMVGKAAGKESEFFTRKRDWLSVPFPLFANAIVSFFLLQDVWSNWRLSSLEFHHWRDAFAFPYLLAGTTILPASVTLAGFGLALFTKLTVEPARVVPEAYMTFIKEEVGGRQAAGIIMILGVLGGTIVGLIWPAS
jgi:hypothetical protein